MKDVVSDFRHAARVLANSPGFTAAAVLMLALGIGANTAIFSLISAVFLRPLPFPDPGCLVAVWEDTKLFGLKNSPPSLGNYVDWRARNHVFENMGALEGASFRMTGDGEPEEVLGAVVSASLFATLGVRPMLGRAFLEEDDRPGAPATIILSHGLWTRRFGGDPAIVGMQIPVNGGKYTVLGVMPPGFRFPSLDADAWAPLGANRSSADYHDRGRHNYLVVARLKQDVTLAKANQDLTAIAAGLQREYPETNTGVGAFAAPLREYMTGGVRAQYVVLLAAVSFVLLIACANVANLLLARAAGRQREIAVRTALGASRARIARQLLAESSLLSGLGAGLGLLLAFVSLRFLRLLLPSGIAGLSGLTVDRLTLGFAAALAVLTALAFGSVPVVQALRVDLNRALKQGGRAGTGSGAGVRGALVVAEVAVSLMLLVGTALMIQSFARLRGVDPGFPSGNLLTMRLPVASGKYREMEARVAFCREILRRVQALPGVISAGFTSGIPVSYKGDYNGVHAEGASERSGGEVPTAQVRTVTAGYLQALGLPLTRGRYLEERDGAGALSVAVVNEAFARKFWPGQNPIGKWFQQGRGGAGQPRYTVVGVVKDMRQSGLVAPSPPEMYIPQERMGRWLSGLLIRTAVEPHSLEAAVRREIRAVNPEQVITRVQTMEEILDRDVFQRRQQSMLLGVFSVLALVLASFGIYGVLAYLVAGRTREIGVRLALGARPADILAGVVRQGLLLTGVGIAIGAAAALALSHTLASLLYGVSARDPRTYTASAAVMVVVALAASVVPARRAICVDPVVALREE